MAPPRKTHCKRGHKYTEKTTSLKVLQTGYTVRQCSICRSELDRLRYRNNPKRAAALRHYGLNRYHAGRADQR